MTREATPFDYLVIAAKAGDQTALDSLSKKAFCGNEEAQRAILEIDSSNWQPRSKTALKSMIWPNKQCGPKKGDIPQHLNV